MTKFIDTHAHLYDERLRADSQQIARAVAAGVTKIFLPNCNSETIADMLRMVEQYPGNCFPMMGLHPTYVKDDYKTELGIVADHLTSEKYYAVGEIGLDYYWDLTHKREQLEAFENQMDLALQHDLPIVIHSRESNTDCIAAVRRKQNGGLRGIFHCFSGTVVEAQQVADLGFLLGIGGVVTYKKSILQDVVAAMPLELLVLETDAPYLSPVPHRGKRNESSYIPLIAAKIAEIKGVGVEKVAEITTCNAEKIFVIGEK